jgi:hypothetical protein
MSWESSVDWLTTKESKSSQNGKKFSRKVAKLAKKDKSHGFKAKT